MVKSARRLYLDEAGPPGALNFRETSRQNRAVVSRGAEARSPNASPEPSSSSAGAG